MFFDFASCGSFGSYMMRYRLHTSHEHKKFSLQMLLIELVRALSVGALHNSRTVTSLSMSKNSKNMKTCIGFREGCFLHDQVYEVGFEKGTLAHSLIRSVFSSQSA